MNICDYCGEHKKVRKVFLMYGGKYGVIMQTTGFYSFNYCCKECSDAIAITNKLNIEKFKKEEVSRKKRWMMKRDKLLKRGAIRSNAEK